MTGGMYDGYSIGSNNNELTHTMCDIFMYTDWSIYGDKRGRTNDCTYSKTLCGTQTACAQIEN